MDISPLAAASAPSDTFASVFPQATMWMVGEGDLLLIGTRGPAIEPYLEGLGERCRMADVRAALSDVAIEGEAAPFAVLSLYAGGPHDLQRFGGSARIETDDRMALEFSAPRAIYGRSDANNADAIRKLAEAGGRPPAVQAALDGATAAGWASRGAMELKAEAFAAAYDAFGRSVTLDSSNAAALRGLSDAAAGCGRETDERSSLQTLVATQPRNAAARVELSRLLASAGELDAAAAAATDAMRIAPDDPRPAEQLASILADAGDAERLGPLADALVAKFPSRADARYFAAAALFLKGRPADAADQARRIVAADPQHAKAHSLLGAACASSGQRDCAREAFEASLRANPRDPTTYVNAGVFLLQSGDPAGASAYFAEALTLDPDSAAARQGLAGARAALAKP